MTTEKMRAMKVNQNRRGTTKEFTIECCHVCDWPKVPSDKHWWKCQNKRCEAFDQPVASAAYHRAHIPLADLLVEEVRVREVIEPDADRGKEIEEAAEMFSPGLGVKTSLTEKNSFRHGARWADATRERCKCGK